MLNVKFKANRKSQCLLSQWLWRRSIASVSSGNMIDLITWGIDKYNKTHKCRLPPSFPQKLDISVVMRLLCCVLITLLYTKSFGNCVGSSINVFYQALQGAFLFKTIFYLFYSFTYSSWDPRFLISCFLHCHVFFRNIMFAKLLKSQFGRLWRERSICWIS